MRQLLITAIVLGVSLCRSSAAAEPDPVALLNEARGLYEKFPAEYRNGRALVPLALVECLYGDRDKGRRTFVEALASAKKTTDLLTRFDEYGLLVQAQSMAGFVEDVHETIRVAGEDGKAVAEEDWYATEVAFLYGDFVIDFYASVDDAASALRFIDSARQNKGNTVEITARILRDARKWPRIHLVDKLLKHGRRKKAIEVLQQTLVDFPELTEDDVNLPALWMRLNRIVESEVAMNKLVAKHNGRDGTWFYVTDAIAALALANIERGNIDAARRLLKIVQGKQGADTSAIEFKIYVKLGEYENAAEIVRMPASGDPKPSKSAEAANRRNQMKKLLALAVLSGRAGKRDLSEGFFADAEKLSAELELKNEKFAAESAAMDLAVHRLAAGDTTALLKAAEKLNNPMMQYMADLLTAIELHVLKTGKGKNFLFPKLEAE